MDQTRKDILRRVALLVLLVGAIVTLSGCGEERDPNEKVFLSGKVHRKDRTRRRIEAKLYKGWESPPPTEAQKADLARMKKLARRRY